jgi:hypothetical protein
MNNLTTHMAELKKILAEIENKTITEGLGSIAAEQIFKDGVKGLAKQEAKLIIKQLGEEVTVTTLRQVGKKKKEIEIELVLRRISGKEEYQVVTQNGKTPRPGQDILSAKQVASDVEKAVEAGRSVKTSGALQIKATSEIAQQAVKNAEGMTDAQLEASIKNTDLSPVLRKEYKEILDKRKANATNPEVKTDKFDTAEVARENAKKLNREQLEKAIANKDISPVTRKAYEEELAKRPKAEPTPREEPAPTPREEPAPTPREEPAKTAEEVAQTKKNAAAKAEAEAAIDAGEVKIKEADLLPAKPGETPSQRVIRTLEEKPGIADKWDNLKGTKGEEGFWQYVKGRKVATLVTALTVAAIAAGIYASTSGSEDLTLDSEDLTGSADGTGSEEDLTTDEAKKKAEEEAAAAATKQKEEAARIAKEKENAAKVSSKEEPSAENNAQVGNNDEELATLKAEIDKLIAELSKSKNPKILKRLAAVKAKLGIKDQGASVTGQGGWVDIGRGYRKWIGPTGKDPRSGMVINAGTVDIIPVDDRERDEYDNMDQSDLADMARKAAGAKKPVKTKSQW